MDEKEKKTDEYKKRIKELIDRVEKDKNTPEFYRQFLEKIEEVKKSAILDIDDKRNDISIIGFASVIQLYKGLDADPNSPYEKDQFQKEIDELYQLIYEELKKPSLVLIRLNLNKFSYNQAEEKDKRRILGHMGMILGMDEIVDFYEKYKINNIFYGTTKDAVITVLFMIGLFAFVLTSVLLYVCVFLG